MTIPAFYVVWANALHFVAYFWLCSFPHNFTADTLQVNAADAQGRHADPGNGSSLQQCGLADRSEHLWKFKCLQCHMRFYCRHHGYVKSKDGTSHCSCKRWRRRCLPPHWVGCRCQHPWQQNVCSLLQARRLGTQASLLTLLPSKAQNPTRPA